MSLVTKRVRGTAKLFLLAWLSVILGITCCVSQETASTGKIEGRVTGKEGEKIAGAKVVTTNRANKQAIGCLIVLCQWLDSISANTPA